MDDEDKKKLSIDEEAKAEEEFIADREDTVENHPLVSDDAAPEEAEKTPEEEKKEGEVLTGAIGSGELEPEEKIEPFNNEAQAQEEAPVAAEGAPAPEATSTSAPDVVEKKKKSGRVLALVVAVILLICGGVALAFFLNWHESTDRMVVEAMAKYIASENRQASAVITIEPKEVDEDEKLALRKLTLSFKSESIKATSSVDGSLGVEIGEKALTFGIHLKYLAGGELYFKLDDTKEAMATVSDLLVDEDADEDMVILEDLLSKVADKMDDQWYKFTLDDVLEDEDDKTLTRCKLSALEALADGEDLQSFADLYADYSFIRVDENRSHGYENGVNSIPVFVDKASAESFAEKLGELEAIKAIDECGSGSSIGGDAEVSDLFEDLPEKDKTEIDLLVKAWSHDLVGMNVRLEDDDTMMTMALEFGLEVTQNIEAPAETRSAEDFGKDIKEAYVDTLTEVAKGYAEELCEESGATNVKACTDETVTYITGLAEDYDTEEILDNMLYTFRSSRV